MHQYEIAYMQPPIEQIAPSLHLPCITLKTEKNEVVHDRNRQIQMN